MARAIANSPLVKTALFGRDPNWGRIAQAAGMALAGEELHELGADDIETELGADEPEAELSVALARGDSQRACLLQRPHLRLRPHQRGVHDVTHDQDALPPDEPLSNASVATLLEALPYIRQFHGQTMVIKYGGAAMRDDDLKEAFATDIALLKFVGINPIIVHGGGPEISYYMEKMGMEVKFVEGLRVSDEQTVEVAKMVLLGKINSDILTRLKRHGQEAVGLGGEDGGLFDVRPVAESDVVGLVGEIERVNVDVIDHIAEDYVPVISSVGTDADGRSYNINADDAAGQVAAAMRAEKVIFMTDVDGWLRDPDDPASRISQAHVREVEEALDGSRGRHAPEARRLRRRRQPRRQGVAHHRRPQGPHPAARALHRRRHRHEDHRAMSARGAGRPSTPSGSCRPTSAPPSSSSAARAPCSGTPTARSTSTSSAGSRSARSATATRGSSRRSASRPGC